MSELKHGLWIPNNPAYLGDFATPTHANEYAVTAEDSGWDGVFLADAMGGAGESYFDPYITFASVASATDSIRLGSWVTPVPRRQPWQVASDLAALDGLSGGRVILGTGLGSKSNYETTGLGYEPKRLGKRFDEALDVIEQLWTGDEIHYHGEHFEVDGLCLPQTPIQQPRIPIAMGCWWPNTKPIRRASRYDGFMPAWDPAYYGDGGKLAPSAENLSSMITEILGYYHEVAEEPGDIFVPIDWPEAPNDFVDHCRDLGMTWALTLWLLDDQSHGANLERIQDGPPGN